MKYLDLNRDISYLELESKNCYMLLCFRKNGYHFEVLVLCLMTCEYSESLTMLLLEIGANFCQSDM